MKLQDLGWTEDWQHKFEPYRGATLAPGRVLAEHKNSYRVATESVELAAEVAGRLRYESFRRSDFPAVGDFVALRLPPGQGPAIVHGILPRKTVFARKVAGERSEEQVIAANLDVIFIVTALDRDFNLRRLERYLTQVWEGGAQPVVLLNKSDVCEDVDKVIATFDPIAFGVPSHVISALAGEGLERLEPYLASGSTVGFVGSSGVGKSTLLNRLLGSEAQATREVRIQDKRGRHTTTHRELFLLPGGGIVIDTPGMRELQLLSDEEGLKRTFVDIDALAAQCAFRDCRHVSELGCAVRAALEAGDLDAKRLASFNKLNQEMRYIESRQDKNAMLERKRLDRIANKAMKPFKSHRS